MAGRIVDRLSDRFGALRFQPDIYSHVWTGLPNGSRLSCGANADGRKRPALRYELVGTQTHSYFESRPRKLQALVRQHEPRSQPEVSKAQVELEQFDHVDLFRRWSARIDPRVHPTQDPSNRPTRFPRDLQGLHRGPASGRELPSAPAHHHQLATRDTSRASVAGPLERR